MSDNKITFDENTRTWSFRTYCGETRGGFGTWEAAANAMKDHLIDCKECLG